MSLYFVGIDISKYKHDCCIISATDQKVISKFSIKNDKVGFEELITTFNSLSSPEDIRIGFESTAHYALNLLEGYGNDNPGAKSQGIKQLMAGGGVVLIGTQLVPLLSGLFS